MLPLNLIINGLQLVKSLPYVSCKKILFYNVDKILLLQFTFVYFELVITELQKDQIVTRPVSFMLFLVTIV